MPRFKKDLLCCGLDVGSQKIKAALLKINENKNAEFLGIYEHPAEGLSGSSVSDLNKLSECIHKTIHNLEKKINTNIKEVYLGVSGSVVDVRPFACTIPITDKNHKVIGSQDLKKIDEQVRLLGVKMDEELLHHFPQMYQVDDGNEALNPVGLYGRKLGVQSLMVVTNVNRIRNIAKAVQQAGYDLSHISFGSLRAGDVCLTEEDQNEGCVLIDIGASVTSILIFRDGILKYVNTLNRGGDYFTQCIADQLNLPFDLAEDIKKSYVSVSSTDNHKDEEILVKKDSKYIPVKREVIYHTIESEILSLVRNTDTLIKASGFFQKINRGITLIGGGALLPGLIERIEQETKMNVRLGQFTIDAQKLGNAALYSTVIGLAYHGFTKYKSNAGSINGQAPWGKFLVEKMRELYVEYF